MKCPKCGTELVSGRPCPRCAELNSLQEQQRLLNEQNNLIRQQMEGAEKERRKAEHNEQLDNAFEDFPRLFEEISNYALKENLKPVWIGGIIEREYLAKIWNKEVTELPLSLIREFFDDGKFSKFNIDIVNLVDEYIKQDRGIALSKDYGKAMPIKLLRKDIKFDGGDSKEAKPITYIPYESGYTVIPSVYLNGHGEGNPEKEIELIQAHSVIWLRENEIDGFTKRYSKIFEEFPIMIEKLEVEKVERQKKQKKAKIRSTITTIIIIAAIIVGIYWFVTNYL